MCNASDAKLREFLFRWGLWLLHAAESPSGRSFVYWEIAVGVADST
jgi:hypothetical protein